MANRPPPLLAIASLSLRRWSNLAHPPSPLPLRDHPHPIQNGERCRPRRRSFGIPVPPRHPQTHPPRPPRPPHLHLASRRRPRHRQTHPPPPRPCPRTRPLLHRPAHLPPAPPP